MSYLSPKAQVKTTFFTSRYGPGKTTVQESITNSASKLQNPTKYKETRIRIGRPGSENAQEIVTKQYQQSYRTTETTTRYDPKTGATQKTTTIGYKPETKVITQTKRRYGPNNETKETTTTRYITQDKNTNPETKPKKKGYGNLQISQATAIKTSGTGIKTSGVAEPPQIVTRTRRKIGPNSSQETTTTTKTAPSTTITETRRKYGPTNCTTEETTRTITKRDPTSTVTQTIQKQHFTSSTLSKQPPSTTESRRRYGPSSSKDEFVTVPVKVKETQTRYGPETKGTKETTYITYQRSRARPITDNNDEKDNKAYFVSEKRSEKYTNDNGNEKRVVTVEKTTSDGGKRRRFYASNK